MKKVVIIVIAILIALGIIAIVSIPDLKEGRPNKEQLTSTFYENKQTLVRITIT